MMRKFGFFVGMLFVANVFAQSGEDKSLAVEAEEKMKAGNYEDALEDYLQLLSGDAKNEIYNYNTGVCYLNTNINKAKAVPYLEIVTVRKSIIPMPTFY